MCECAVDECWRLPFFPREIFRGCNVRGLNPGWEKIDTTSLGISWRSSLRWHTRRLSAPNFTHDVAVCRGMKRGRFRLPNGAVPRRRYPRKAEASRGNGVGKGDRSPFGGIPGGSHKRRISHLKSSHPPRTRGAGQRLLIATDSVTVQGSRTKRAINHHGDSPHRASAHQPRSADDDLHAAAGMYRRGGRSKQRASGLFWSWRCQGRGIPRAGLLSRESLRCHDMLACDGNEIGDGASMTVPNEEASITAFSLLAPMIQINWQSSDRPKSTTSFRASVTKTSTTGRVRSTSSETSTGETESDNTSETKTSDGSRGETLVLDEHPQTTGGEVDIGGGAPTTTPTLQENESSPDNGAMSSGAKVAIGVASAVGVLMVLVCALFYCWRKRKTRREEQELDRLYGLKHSMSIGGDFTNSSDIPGWYRGQRLATATKDPFGVHDANHGAMMPEMERPAAPYYRPYRPA